jgi:hypothetical protein
MLVVLGLSYDETTRTGSKGNRRGSPLGTVDSCSGSTNRDAYFSAFPLLQRVQTSCPSDLTINLSCLHKERNQQANKVHSVTSRRCVSRQPKNGGLDHHFLPGLSSLGFLAAASDVVALVCRLCSIAAAAILTCLPV